MISTNRFRFTSFTSSCTTPHEIVPDGLHFTCFASSTDSVSGMFYTGKHSGKANSSNHTPYNAGKCHVLYQSLRTQGIKQSPGRLHSVIASIPFHLETERVIPGERRGSSMDNNIAYADDICLFSPSYGHWPNASAFGGGNRFGPKVNTKRT